MNMKYEKTIIEIVHPENADPRTMLSTIGQLYRIDRYSKPEVEGENPMFFLEEIPQEHKEEPEDLVEPTTKEDNLLGKML